MRACLLLVLLAGTAYADDIRVPNVMVTRADGARVPLRRELDDGRPVILSFMFTSCSTICPVLGHILLKVQKRLGERVHLVSFSIDPEHDTPERLRDYARGIDARWSFYTATLEVSLAVQRAFSVYRGDKMNHAAVTFVRVSPKKPWLRLDGFAGADEIVARVSE